MPYSKSPKDILVCFNLLILALLVSSAPSAGHTVILHALNINGQNSSNNIKSALTNSVSSTSADCGQALDESADIGCGRSAGQLAHEVFGELSEQSGTTTWH